MDNVSLKIFGPSRSTVVRNILIVMTGAAVMTLSARIQIPFWPVPMTLHTLAVMGFAVAFGPRLAVSIFLTYLAAGAAGLPVFAGSPERGIGFAYMAGPTGGYLAGYLGASWLVGKLSLGRGALGRIGAMLAGLVPIYGGGIAWLAIFVPFEQLFSLGIAPFLLGDLLKIGVVATGSALFSMSLTRSRDVRP